MDARRKLPALGHNDGLLRLGQLLRHLHLQLRRAAVSAPRRAGRAQPHAPRLPGRLAATFWAGRGQLVRVCAALYLDVLLQRGVVDLAFHRAIDDVGIRHHRRTLCAAAKSGVTAAVQGQRAAGMCRCGDSARRAEGARGAGGKGGGETIITTPSEKVACPAISVPAYLTSARHIRKPTSSIRIFSVLARSLIQSFRWTCAKARRRHVLRAKRATIAASAAKGERRRCWGCGGAPSRTATDLSRRPSVRIGPGTPDG